MAALIAMSLSFTACKKEDNPVTVESKFAFNTPLR